MIFIFPREIRECETIEKFVKSTMLCISGGGPGVKNALKCFDLICVVICTGGLHEAMLAKV